MKILVRADNSLTKFAEKVDSQLAKAISKQMITYIDKLDKQSFINLLKGLRNWSLAYVINSRLTLIFRIWSMSQYKSDPNEEPLIDLVHISEDDGGLEPYFVFFNAESDEWISNAMNKLWVKLKIRSSQYFIAKL